MLAAPTASVSVWNSSTDLITSQPQDAHVITVTARHVFEDAFLTAHSEPGIVGRMTLAKGLSRLTSDPLPCPNPTMETRLLIPHSPTTVHYVEMATTQISRSRSALILRMASTVGYTINANVTMTGYSWKLWMKSIFQK